MKIALFTKKNKPTVSDVIEYLKIHSDLYVYSGKIGDPFPVKFYNDFSSEYKREQPDLLISYLSPWIIPKNVLNMTKGHNINFHPGPPKYPGFGCFNFALYNNEAFYGVTAHIMEEKIDTGKIIGVKNFQILENETVYSLSIKSYGYMLYLFYEIIDYKISFKGILVREDVWQRKPYTRKDLEELCRITPDMPEREVERRIKATTYPNMPGAYIDLYGHKFEYNSKR